ncbi:MAG: hypothetical protein IJV22_03315 [Bacteroidales bacterium]|nr:hypothetical protein [Bacteroidales bacterium]
MGTIRTVHHWLWHIEKTIEKQRTYEQLTFKADGTFCGRRKWQSRQVGRAPLDPPPSTASCSARTFHGWRDTISPHNPYFGRLRGADYGHLKEVLVQLLVSGYLTRPAGAYITIKTTPKSEEILVHDAVSKIKRRQ